MPPEPPNVPVGPHVDHDILVVGDIAQCRPGTSDAPNALATGLLASRIAATYIFAVGDTVYNDADPPEYSRCFDQVWGHQKLRIKPALGNHEYTPRAPNAEGYFQYFGAYAELGYYSVNLGSWHLIVLNSEVVVNRSLANDQTARRQMEFLERDLSLYRNWKCTAMFWHHPRFTTGPNGDHPAMDQIVRMAYAADVDAIFNGHDHMYKRFDRRDPSGFSDPIRGIRQFIVGTGGASLYDEVRPSSEPYLKQFGLLKVGLRQGGFNWQFLSIGGSTFDANSEGCH